MGVGMVVITSDSMPDSVDAYPIGLPVPKLEFLFQVVDQIWLRSLIT